MISREILSFGGLVPLDEPDLFGQASGPEMDKPRFVVRYRSQGYMNGTQRSKARWTVFDRLDCFKLLGTYHSCDEATRKAEALERETAVKLPSLLQTEAK